MAKHTESAFRARWNDFVNAACAEWGTSATALFNTTFSLHEDTSGGNVMLVFYPDYDDNDHIPAVFMLGFGSDNTTKVSITWEEMESTEMTTEHPSGARKLWLAVTKNLELLLTHWVGLQTAIDEVKKWTTVGSLGTSFGPDSDDSRSFLKTVSDAYHKHDIHS
jgi:hypothetical protein